MLPKPMRRYFWLDIIYSDEGNQEVEQQKNSRKKKDKNRVGTVVIR